MTPRKHSFYIAFVTAVLYTAAVVLSVIHNGYFISDDYEDFYFVRQHSFWRHLVTWVNDLFLPLYRLLTYMIYKLLPLNYTFAVIVLSALHVLTLWYLHRILRLLGDSRVNRVLMFLYATNVYLFAPLIWWAAGGHRMPYILLSVVCIYHYLKYRRTESKLQFLIAFVAFVAAFFTHGKAALIPGYLLGLEWCLRERAGGPRSLRHFLVLIPFFMASALQFFLYRLFIPIAFKGTDADFVFMASFVRESFKFFGAGVFSVIYDPADKALNVSMALCWIGFFVYSVRKSRFNIHVWLVGLSVVALNFLLVAISPRNNLGLGLVLAHRYYFEIMFLVVIFLKLILDNTPVQEALSGFPVRVRGALSSGRLWTALAIAYASMSFVSVTRTLATPAFADYRQTKAYMRALSSGIAGLKADPPENLSFMNGPLPEYLAGWNWTVHSHRDLLELFDLKASYDVPTVDLYVITETGEVRRIE